ncbi:hypothetical protein V5O48_000290 [Marasmius crinis-equi]|uniref:Protein transport protein sec16 n=1 Tax=Marasmius crinis-equi TaxID=585013 RepID=A0ABR3G210_9AGAR
MSELESAASLFGSPNPNDSSKDPFASNGNDPFSSLGASTTENTSTDPFSSLGHDTEVSAPVLAPETSSETSANGDLFGASSTSDGLFDSIGNQQGGAEADFFSSTDVSQGTSSWPAEEGGGEEAYYQNTAGSDVGSGAAAAMSYEPVSSSAQASTHGQEWSGYSPMQNSYGYSGYGQDAGYYGGANGPSSTNTGGYDPYAPQSGTPSNVYDPYAPTSVSTTNVNGYGTNNAYAPTQQQSPYAPAPAASVPTNAYAPTQQSPYAPAPSAPAAPPPTNPYAPTQPSPYAPAPAVAPVAPATPNYGTPSYIAASTSPYAATTATSQAVPSVPPPAPKAPLNRPKVSNAYDPPFPAASSARRASSRSNPSLSSAFSAYASPPPVPPIPANITQTSSYAPPPQRPSSASYNETQTAATPGRTQSVPPSQDYASQYSYQPPPSQSSRVDPYAPSSVSGSSAPPARFSPPQSSFSPPPRSGSVISSTRSPPPNVSSLNRMGSPFQAQRTSSPAGNHMPPQRSSMQQVSASTPPPPAEISRVSSPGSANSPRIRSPSISSTHSQPGLLQQPFRTASPATAAPPPAVDPYAPITSGTHTVPPPTNDGEANPYLPKNIPESTQSPYAPSGSSRKGSVDKRYAPRTSSTLPPPPLNGSLPSAEGAAASDPYAPSRHPRKQMSESDYGSWTTRYDYPSQEAPPAPSSFGLGPPQEIKAPTHAPYAPSPSLLGTNDPLGRAGARIPVFSFGFGGKIVTCFHGADKLSTGFDVALASRNSTGVSIRVLNKVIPESALDLSPSSFPGPLFSDPGTPTTALVRTGASTQMKNKKTRLLKYLSDRAEEISMGLGYLHAGTAEKRQAEGKLILVKLLKILIEHDGKLLGTPQAEVAVRNALVPELDLSTSSTSDADSFTSPGFSALGEDIALQSSVLPNDLSDPSVTVSTLRPSSLDKIQDFLLRGEKRKAYHYALDQKLWAHAMVIASGIDKEAWKEVVNEFLRSELGSKDLASKPSANPAFAHAQPLSGAPAPGGTTNGREGLRVAYSLFSGQGPAAVQELIPQNLMLQPQPQARLTLPAAHTTPMTPNFAAPAPAANIPQESLAKWAEMVAMVICGAMTPESSSALTALGDQLSGNGWVEAGHVCYLLSPQTSPIAGMGNASARIVLLGAPNPHTSTKYIRDTDPIIFSEILEFALGLHTPAKGHEPFPGLPHLQAFRLIRAMYLAEIGEVSLAKRYCEAITASMSRPSPYFTPFLSDQLRGLVDRISGTAHSDKSNSWVGGKIGKPSLDGIGGWLEGRFTKLVTGDEEDNEARSDNKGEGQEYAGPFSTQYSAMSSNAPSNDNSPQSSVVNLNSYAPPPPASVPGRTGSAMSNRSFLGHQSVPVPHERASSAMDYGTRRKASPGPRIASASAYTTTFAQSGQAQSIYSPPGTAKQDDVRRSSSEIKEEDEGQEVTWWGSSSYGYNDNGKTPTTATFVQLGAGDQPAVNSSNDGFISLMDNNHYAPSPSASTSSFSRSAVNEVEEDEEDLGFGNAKPKPKPSHGDNGNDAESKAPSSAPAPAQRPDIKPIPAAGASNGSWLSRWWKRDSSTPGPGPVKANLGEETSFYYDKDLKRWVNKTSGGAEAAKPATPPPPPSRAQTASPGMSGGPGARPPSAGPPPLRSASAADLSGTPPPPKTGPMRIRSNLVPSDVPGSAPGTPTGGSHLMPPGGPPRPKSSQAAKRNVRSRYVDVFQQEGGAA